MKTPLKCLLVCGALLLAACSSPSGTAATSQASPQPALPVVSATPAVVAPIDAPTPEPAAPRNPASLNPGGPYVLFEGDDGIWIANPDGSFLTRLSDTGVGEADLGRSVSPQGDALAFIRPSEHGPQLIQLDLPGGQTKVLATLQAAIPDDVVAYPLTDQAFAYYAITLYDNVAWQPGGARYLAFTGAINGPTSDLYLYDTETEAVTQLTDGGSQAVYPTWSPDGEYILHFGGRWTPPFGGAIIGYNQADGAWAVRLEDGAVITQPAGVLWPWNFVGWTADSRYIASEADDVCGERNLLRIPAGGGEPSTLFEGCFAGYAALSPANEAVLFSSSDCEDCPLGVGTFLLPSAETDPLRVLEAQSWGIDWLEEGNAFHAYPEALVSSEGEVLARPPVPDASYHPALSLQGYEAWEVIENQQGRVVVRPLGGESRTILEAGVASLIWDPLGGDTLLIATRDGHLMAASAPEFEARLVGDLGGMASQAAWVP